MQDTVTALTTEDEARLGHTVRMLAGTVADIEAVAAWVINHGEHLPADDHRLYWGSDDEGRIVLNVHCRDRDELVHVVRALAHGAAIGEVRKSETGSSFSMDVRRRFGSVHVRAWVPHRQVCERVVVGARTVPEHVEEVVEWRCPGSLLADKSRETAA